MLAKLLVCLRNEDFLHFAGMSDWTDGAKHGMCRLCLYPCKSEEKPLSPFNFCHGGEKLCYVNIIVTSRSEHGIYSRPKLNTYRTAY